MPENEYPPEVSMSRDNVKWTIVPISNEKDQRRLTVTAMKAIRSCESRNAKIYRDKSAEFIQGWLDTCQKAKVDPKTVFIRVSDSQGWLSMPLSSWFHQLASAGTAESGVYISHAAGETGENKYHTAASDAVSAFSSLFNQ